MKTDGMWSVSVTPEGKPHVLCSCIAIICKHGGYNVYNDSYVMVIAYSCRPCTMWVIIMARKGNTYKCQWNVLVISL